MGALLSILLAGAVGGLAVCIVGRKLGLSLWAAALLGATGGGLSAQLVSMSAPRYALASDQVVQATGSEIVWSVLGGGAFALVVALLRNFMAR